MTDYYQYYVKRNYISKFDVNSPFKILKDKVYGLCYLYAA